ncbi:MAG: hypothetical protein KF721_16010 [Ignavibacteriaceae bacterium]|nr:hypothetical protein [Ignavibacteriaceae bacterium]
MNLIELSKYLQDEQAAENYLYKKGILKKYTECHHCGFDKLGHLSRNRIKCYKCKKEWHKRKGSFLEGKQISCSKFIAFLKLYAEEIGVNRITDELELDKKTVIFIHSSIRQLIVKELHHSNNPKKLKAFIWMNKDKIEIDFDRPPSAGMHESANYFELDFSRYKEYGNLYSFLVNSKWIGKKQHHYKMLDRFLGFLKMKLISYRGLKVEYFIDFLLELIIKFNNRDKIFYEEVLEILQNSKGG